jgi:hypothetical protein
VSVTAIIRTLRSTVPKPSPFGLPSVPHRRGKVRPRYVRLSALPVAERTLSDPPWSKPGNDGSLTTNRWSTRSSWCEPTESPPSSPPGPLPSRRASWRKTAGGVSSTRATPRTRLHAPARRTGVSVLRRRRRQTAWHLRRRRLLGARCHRPELGHWHRANTPTVDAPAMLLPPNTILRRGGGDT